MPACSSRGKERAFPESRRVTFVSPLNSPPPHLQVNAPPKDPGSTPGPEACRRPLPRSLGRRVAAKLHSGLATASWRGCASVRVPISLAEWGQLIPMKTRRNGRSGMCVGILNPLALVPTLALAPAVDPHPHPNPNGGRRGEPAQLSRGCLDGHPRPRVQHHALPPLPPGRRQLAPG